MRQAVAIGFLLLAFENLKSKKYVKYFLEILLAMSFHGSAILGILYLFASRFKYKKKYNKLQDSKGIKKLEGLDNNYYIK